jgi:FkbM family methyltransferase
MLDIGASGGIVPLWKQLKGHLHVLCVEPDNREFEQLEKRTVEGVKIDYLNKLLYKEKQPSLTFNQYNNQRLSSLLQPNERFLSKFSKTESWSVAGEVELEADTLDKQLSERNINDIDFIKLDTQGSELSILEGAGHLLDNSLFGLSIEVEFAPIYKDQALFSDIDVFLRRKGFQLIEIVRSKYWRRTFDNQYVKSGGQIIYGDVLYLRDPEIFIEKLRQRKDVLFAKTRLIKAAVISELYNHKDYGYELLLCGIEAELFNEQETEWIRSCINADKLFRMNVIEKLPDFPGKETVTELCYRFYHMFKKRDDQWTKGGQWR